MRIFNKFLLNLIFVVFVLMLFYYCIVSNKINTEKYFLYKDVQNTNGENSTSVSTTLTTNSTERLNLWFIFTKVTENAPLLMKFENLLRSLFTFNSMPVHVNVVTDNKSKFIAKRVLEETVNISRSHVLYSFYDMEHSISMVRDLVENMKPFFSSQPGAYYNDALFYLSLGLHRIAPQEQSMAIMIDCDIKFMKDPVILYKEFNKFTPSTLFGLAHELTPVYRHVLNGYRSRHSTTFGEFLHEKPVISWQNHPNGFPGYNSGVILFNLSAIRESDIYSKVITKENVLRLTQRYRFKGHLGDQDLYTLLGYVYPELFITLPCVFNRQLCVWWRDNGYSDVFSNYSSCHGDVVIYHGNCNTRIPPK